MANLTKAQLEAELKRKETELAAANQRADEAEEAASTANQRAEYYENRTSGDMDLSDPEVAHDDAVEDAAVRREPDVLYDPFDAQNPHQILHHPQGYRLSWVNPMYRDQHLGWRGWIPVEYDDEIGRNLKRYLLEVPHRMEHQQDNYVRRGDSMLARLPEGIWLARQNKRVEKANRYQTEHAQDFQRDNGFGGRDTPIPQGTLAGRKMTS